MTYEEYKKITAHLSEQELDDFEKYVSDNYDDIRSAYEEDMLDLWDYSPSMIDEVSDWRDEYCLEYYENR